MANILEGYGPPSRHRKGEVGQHYTNLENGDVYECVVASEHSKVNLHTTGGYIWKKIADGDHLEVCTPERVVFNYMAMFGDLVCSKTAAEIDNLLRNERSYNGVSFVFRNSDFSNPTSVPDYFSTKIDTESIYIGGVYRKLVYHIYFGDEAPPVLVDVIADTITVDPDWVDPSYGGTAMILKSSTEGSTKRFKVTVNDSGTLTATEIV